VVAFPKQVLRGGDGIMQSLLHQDHGRVQEKIAMQSIRVATSRLPMWRSERVPCVASGGIWEESGRERVGKVLGCLDALASTDGEPSAAYAGCATMLLA
jgi:hypothetical protein